MFLKENVIYLIIIIFRLIKEKSVFFYIQIVLIQAVSNSFIKIKSRKLWWIKGSCIILHVFTEQNAVACIYQYARVKIFFGKKTKNSIQFDAHKNYKNIHNNQGKNLIYRVRWWNRKGEYVHNIRWYNTEISTVYLRWRCQWILLVRRCLVLASVVL